MSLFSFCTSLSQTPFSVWLREATYTYPALIIVHVVTIGLFGGVVVMGNLRILGYALTSTPPSEVLNQFRPWKWVGFWLLLVTGVLLMVADPMEYYDNKMNWLKIATLLLAGVNAMVFHYGAERSADQWNQQTPPSPAARGWAIRSLVFWVALVFIGRATAFF